MLIWSFLTLAHLVTAGSLLRIARPIKALNIRDLVVARQSSTGDMIPAQCETDCDSINAELAQRCPTQDCCQLSFISGYATCLECIGIALGATNFTLAQQMLDNLTMLCDSKGFDVPSLTLSEPAASGALSSAPATVISNMPSTNAPADTSTPSTIVPAQSTDSPAQSTNAPTQSTITNSSAQSTNITTSSAKQSCLIPHLLHVQVSVALLGGLIHLAL